ncbi:hypothetical protein D1007_21405 [Hordeum vulgare]|nr:hypothetical protein D1007_21405 [Hordeum vulgare]
MVDKQRPCSVSSSQERREIPPNLFGMCFKCFREGHMREDCKFKPLCIWCGLEGHISLECKRQRSPRSEEELRHDVMPKVARTSQPSMSARLAHKLSQVARQATLLERPSPAVTDSAPVGFGQAPTSATGSICALRRSPEMDDLEQRLRLAVVAYVGGTRPGVSCREVAEAISVVLEILRHRFSVHKFQPEDFLVVFDAADLCNIALAAGSIKHGHFKLFVRP